jgi:ABC-2 type transport system permease protein
MRHFPTILGHEVRMLLVNPSTYVAGVLFLALMGFVFSGVLDTFSKAPQESAPAFLFFRFFFFPVLIMVPLLTMRSLAEERRQGTIETLLTAPVNTTEVVLGKYFAAYLMYIALWASTSGFFYILYQFAGDTRLLDSGPLTGGYCFIAVSGLLFVSVGIFASSLFRNQLVAGFLAFALLFGLILGLRYLAEVPYLQSEALVHLRSAVDAMQVFEHFEDFSRGIVDTRQILFYLSGTALMLLFSILSVEAKLLHS